MCKIVGVQTSGVPAGTVVPCGTGIGITSISATNPAVVTTTLNHGLLTGDLVVITGTSTTPSTVNTYTVTVTSNTTFTIPLAVTVAGGAAGVVSKIPPRMLLCDGQSYSRALYPTLFAAIGTSFGSVDANSFNVPDFRGRFLRGVSAASANDPDRAGRTAMNTGGFTGNNVGSVQGHDFASHGHSITVYDGGSTTDTAIKSSAYFGGVRTGGTNASGGNETRPVNAYVHYCISF